MHPIIFGKQPVTETNLSLQVNHHCETSKYPGLEISFSFQKLDVATVKTTAGYFFSLGLPDGYHTGKAGTPALPAIKRLVEIPFGIAPEVVITKHASHTIELSRHGITGPLIPVQPSLPKNSEPGTFPFAYDASAYEADTLIAQPLVSLEVLGVLRGIRLARLTISPVAYHPRQSSIEVHTNIEVDVLFHETNKTENHLGRQATWSPFFEGLYDKVIRIPDSQKAFDSHPDLVRFPVSMLVISHPDFRETLQPFIEWQTRKGFRVIEAYTDETGNTPANIKAFIREQYLAGTPEVPAPSFLILVGDHDKLPASAIGSATNEVTDLYYASVDGDMFPDMYYGRLSARNTQELQNQIDKILYYQQYAFDDPSYLNNVTLIAGQDDTWNPRIGQPSVLYATDNYFNTDMGFEHINAYLNSYTGCYEEARIASSLVSFTAHCSPTSWSSPTLRISDIYQMTNTGRYPLALGNCCQSGLFSQPESIGEAWVRAPGKGAVAYIGSAPNTYWFEDFYWIVGAFPMQGSNDGYVPSKAETTLGAYDAPFESNYLSLGALQFVGNLAVTVVDLENYPSHSSPLYYWQAYHTFGDPSTFIYFTEGQENQVTLPPVIPMNTENMYVEALPGSYVGISMDGVLLGAASIGESGGANIRITPVYKPGEASIVVTRHQTIPYIETLQIQSIDGPFIRLLDYTINDESGNDNGQADYGETIFLHVTLENTGNDKTGVVSATLTGSDPYIMIENEGNAIGFPAMETLGDEGDKHLSTVENAFELYISRQVPDQHQASFNLLITNGQRNWESKLTINASAPVLSIDPTFSFDDSMNGNGNGRLDPGETASVTFTLVNAGSATAINPMAKLTGNSAYLTIEQETKTLSPIDPGQSYQLGFSISAHPSTPQGTEAMLECTVEDGTLIQEKALIAVGQPPEVILGAGNFRSHQYPFYNFYKANRSQMLIRTDELGPGQKMISSIGMYFQQLSKDLMLPNFFIRIKQTNAGEMPDNDFVDMEGSAEVFSDKTYLMPASLGWHFWEIEPFMHNGTSNLIVEISWGMLPNYNYPYFQVACSQYQNRMVAYGYSDYHPVPAFNGTSVYRPNLHLGFEGAGQANEEEIGFLVVDENAQPIEHAFVRIGSKTELANAAGMVNFFLAQGNFDYAAGYQGFQMTHGEVTVDGQSKVVEIVLLTTDNFPGIPKNITVANENIFHSQPVCFDATHTITLGGAAGPVTVHSGGSANFVAGQNIVMLPGTHFYAGSYVHAWIAPDGPFCGEPDKQMVAAEILEPDGEVELKAVRSEVKDERQESLVKVENKKLFKVYPNPTLGRVTLELHHHGQTSEIRIEIYGIRGERILSEKLSGDLMQHELSLEGQMPGIYIIRVVSEHYTGIERIIKR